MFPLYLLSAWQLRDYQNTKFPRIQNIYNGKSMQMLFAYWKKKSEINGIMHHKCD